MHDDIVAYVVGSDGPDVDAEVDEVLVTVRVSHAFGNSLEFCASLPFEAELGGQDSLSEVWYNVEYESVDEFIGLESYKTVEKVVLQILVPRFYKIVGMDALNGYIP